jgi:protein-disulfide isomerase
MRSYFIIYTALLLFINCKNTSPKKDYIAKVNNVTISSATVDHLIEQELYGTIQQIYFLRKTAAEELVHEQLLELEARERKITKEQLVTQEIESKITPENIEVYIKELALEERGIPNINNGYRLVNVRSEEGRQLVKEDFRRYLKNNLLTSLKNKYPVEINLQPPTPPAISTAGIPVMHYRGHTQSAITFLEISDFECDNCRKNASLYKAIFEKYKDKVRFAFTHFSGGVTLSATIAEAAGKQGKFWEAHDALFAHPGLHPTDTAAYLQLMQQAGIDTGQLKKAIKDTSTYQSIKNNINAVKAAKIYATPTLLINGRMVMEPFNKDAIVKELEYRISKLK